MKKEVKEAAIDVLVSQVFNFFIWFCVFMAFSQFIGSESLYKLLGSLFDLKLFGVQVITCFVIAGVYVLVFGSVDIAHYIGAELASITLNFTSIILFVSFFVLQGEQKYAPLLLALINIALAFFIKKNIKSNEECQKLREAERKRELEKQPPFPPPLKL